MWIEYQIVTHCNASFLFNIIKLRILSKEIFPICFFQFNHVNLFAKLQKVFGPISFNRCFNSILFSSSSPLSFQMESSTLYHVFRVLVFRILIHILIVLWLLCFFFYWMKDCSISNLIEFFLFRWFIILIFLKIFLWVRLQIKKINQVVLHFE